MGTDFDNDPYFYNPLSEPMSERQFPLIEALAAIGISVLLIAAFVPFPTHCGEPMRRAQCVNNLKQIALALRDYERDYKALPPAYTVDANGKPLHSWRTLILPYLDQSPLYRTIDLAKPWNDPANSKAYWTLLPAFVCPSRAHATTMTPYLAMVDSKGCFLPDQPRRLAEITDPHEQTLMVLEVDQAHAVHWMAPMDADGSVLMSLGTASKPQHSGSTNACLVDASVRVLKADITAQQRRALISIAGTDHEALKDW